jgi:hypothetical protein
MLLKRLLKIFTSLRLTVVLLAFAILLVFIGTLAQVDEGLYQAQARYFRQWIILGLDMFGKKIPVILPGGYLIGGRRKCTWSRAKPNRIPKARAIMN